MGKRGEKEECRRLPGAAREAGARPSLIQPNRAVLLVFSHLPCKVRYILVVAVKRQVIHQFYIGGLLPKEAGAVTSFQRVTLPLQRPPFGILLGRSRSTHYGTVFPLISQCCSSSAVAPLGWQWSSPRKGFTLSNCECCPLAVRGMGIGAAWPSLRNQNKELHCMYSTKESIGVSCNDGWSSSAGSVRKGLPAQDDQADGDICIHAAYWVLVTVVIRQRNSSSSCLS